MGYILVKYSFLCNNIYAEYIYMELTRVFLVPPIRIGVARIMVVVEGTYV